jgi:hypothetical protein
MGEGALEVECEDGEDVSLLWQLLSEMSRTDGTAQIKRLNFSVEKHRKNHFS